ncbi:hypothetical protein QFC22_006351 [Naganishia vaughanmartiniae]|uniref:Uncharacterized protein n=1 Tax=Naganishia vaughanmartiniae TaxID=1424756 RepID=A0ACC2WK93_9TREE|nr:hypothetical protein QFC22_006351 [Naganishia vaughanmartiniae]
MGKNKKKSQRTPAVVPPAETAAAPISAGATTPPPIVETKDELPIREEPEVVENLQGGEESVTAGEDSTVQPEIVAEIAPAVDEPENKQEPTSASIPTSPKRPSSLPEPQAEEDLFASVQPTKHDDLFATIGTSHARAEPATQDKVSAQSTPPRESKAEQPAPATPTSPKPPTSTLEAKAEEDLFTAGDATEHDDLFANIAQSHVKTESVTDNQASIHQELSPDDVPAQDNETTTLHSPPTAETEDQAVPSTGEHKVDFAVDMEQDVEGSPVKVHEHDLSAPIAQPADEQPTSQEEAASRSVDRKLEAMSTEQNTKTEPNDDLFGDSSVLDETSFFDQAAPPVVTRTSDEAQPSRSHPEESPVKQETWNIAEETVAEVQDGTDLLFGATTEATEFNIAVEQSHTSPDRKSDSPHPPTAEKDSSDLFGASDAAEPDLFGNAPANHDDEDLFATVVQAEDTDDLFGSSAHDQGEEENLFASRQETEQEPDLFGDAGETGHDLDFITNPAPAAQATEATPKSAEPVKQRVEDMDLDAAGVPQGWVDEQGGWNWYTAEERLDVARGMFGEEQEMETAQQSSTAEPTTNHVDSNPAQNTYAPQQVPSSSSYNPTPHSTYAPPTTTFNYAPTANAATNAPVTYDPYKPAPAAPSTSRSAYSPVSQSSGFNAYQRPITAAPSHGQVNPPARTFSPYDPPAKIVSQAHVFTPPAPVLTAEPAFQPSLRRSATRPIPALTRMKTSTAYDPPMIPVTKAMSRPASAAPVITPFAPFGLPGSVSTPSVGTDHRPPPGVTPPPPSGPPKGPSRVTSPASIAGHNMARPPQRQSQPVPALVPHPPTPNAYDPPTLPAMPNRPASRVAAAALGMGGAPAVASPVGQQAPLPPPPISRSVSAMNPPPRAPASATRSPQVRSQTQLPLQPVLGNYEHPPSQPAPPAVNAYSPAHANHGLPPQHMSLPRPAKAAPPTVSQPPQYGQPPRASSPAFHGIPPSHYQPPPFSRPSSGMNGVVHRPASRNATVASYPNENHARQSLDHQRDPEELQEQFEPEQGEEEQREPSTGEDDFDPEGGAFDEEEEEEKSQAIEYSYAQSTSRVRPTLGHDTFAPPSKSAHQRQPLSTGDDQISDPYAPQTLLTSNTPPAQTSARPVTAPYAGYASDLYTPHSRTSQSYVPVSTHQTHMPFAGPSSPAVNTPSVPAEPYSHSQAKPPSVSAYDPAEAVGQQSADESHLARASPAARRVPCVSFGPHGKLVVAFQRDPEAESSAQVTSLAYGDSSSGLPVHIRRLADSLPPLAEMSGTTQWPGPLLTDPQASKTSTAEKKKRDTLNAFLTERIQEIESGLPYLSASGKDIVTRANQEAIMLLYQVAQLMLKHDGKVFSSDPTAQAELKAILPKLSENVAKSAIPDVVSDRIDAAADMQFLSECLLKGDQQAALTYATERNMWSHALLLAAGIDSATWTSTVSDFVKATVQGAGADDSRAVLATAYSIYGQGGPTVVEQIPDGDLPSIWRNSLATIVASSKPNDATYVIALAEKLKKQGLIEAAHLCYVLSPMIVAWQQSRPDSPITLIGASETDQQTEATLISEIMEYAMWLRPVPKGAETFHGVPHLLQYKVNKAATLFAAGEAALAKRYCEAVIASLRLRKVPDQASQLLKLQLQNLLSQINGEDFSVSSAKGLPKPKLENLGSWFEGTLTKFIAGEESESGNQKAPGHMKKASSGSAGIGPFSHFSAITPEATPSLPSRTMSTYDIPATAYAPPIPRSGSAMSYRPQPASQPPTQQRPTSAMAYGRQETRLSALSQVTAQVNEPAGYEPSGYSPSGYAPVNHGHTAEPAADLGPQQEEEKPSSESYEPVQEEVHAVEIPSWGQSYTFEDGNTQPNADDDASEDAGSFINPMANFITPAVSTHPSAAPTPPIPYRPRTNDVNLEDEEDDDLGLGNASNKKKPAGSAASAPKTSTPTSNYAPPAKENHAVETQTEESEKPKESPKPGATGGSWLGRLWGKGAAEAPTSGPVKAKLGNESSMYYDKELKRWVTKGPGGQPEAPKAAPPPPRTPRPSTPAAASPAAAMPPASRPTSAAPPAFGAGPVRSQTATPAMSGLATPPTRPASSATVGDPPIGNALAPPPARKGTAGKKGIRARYVEIT